MSESKLKVGDKVDYFSIVGGSASQVNQTIESIELAPNNYGCDVARVSGIRSVVSMENLIKSTGIPKVVANLQCSLGIECPQCKKDYDLLDTDNEENTISNAIFGDWGQLNNEETCCPHCNFEFEVHSVEM